MAERPDYLGLIAGHANVIDMINAGGAGLPALHHLLKVSQAAFGAAGMSFTEFGPHGGRIIAATGASDWSLGRPVDHRDPAIRWLFDGPRSWNSSVNALDDALAQQLRGRGLCRMLGARAEIGGSVVGSLHAYFPDPGCGVGQEEHTLIRYLAACTAHLYGDHCGLPIHGDGPVVAARADGLAILDREGTVRSRNPAADRAEPDRDLFVAVTSHELRTPVTVIKGYADTLTNHWESLSEPDRQEAVRVIGQRAGELARLVDRLLSSASEADPVGGAPPAPFDLVAGLMSAVNDLPANLRHRLSRALPHDLPKAFGDRGMLPTVLTELATNADKYSPGDSPIGLTAGADQRTVFFRVSDRGIGVRPEHVERAFERFWQGESGDRRRYPGAGLGLYLVRRIIERQHGWVFLRPREGGGTVAEVRLPRADVAVRRAAGRAGVP